MKERIVRTTCGICQIGCGVLAYISEDRVLRIEGLFRFSDFIRWFLLRRSRLPDRFLCKFTSPPSCIFNISPTSLQSTLIIRINDYQKKHGQLKLFLIIFYSLIKNKRDTTPNSRSGCIPYLYQKIASKTLINNDDWPSSLYKNDRPPPPNPLLGGGIWRRVAGTPRAPAALTCCTCL